MTPCNNKQITIPSLIKSVTLCLLMTFKSLSPDLPPRPNGDSLLPTWSGDRIPVEAIFSATVQTCHGAQPAFCTMGTRSPSWGQGGRGLAITTPPPPPLGPRLKRQQSYISTLEVELYLYSQSRAIYLLPFRTVMACSKN